MAENNTVKYYLAKDASKPDPRAILEMLNMRQTDQQLLTLTLKKKSKKPIIEAEELQVRLSCLGDRLTDPVTEELVSKHVKTESFRYRDKHKSIIHLVFHP